jgi:hypothetical protein
MLNVELSTKCNKTTSMNRKIQHGIYQMRCLDQWFPTCGTHTPWGMRRTGWGYMKIILVIAENTKKGAKIKTQKQRYEVLVYKEKLTRPSHH